MRSLIVPVGDPIGLPTSAVEASRHLRLDEPDDVQVEVLESLITAAANYLGGVDGVLGRALMTQTFDLKIEAFPWGSMIDDPAYAWPIKVWLKPLRSVEYIKYIDPDGAEQTWSSADYVVNYGRNWIQPALGVAYPATRPNEADAVTVRFVAGHTADQLPAADKLLVLWLVANWYEHREPSAIGTVSVRIPEHFERLIDARRNWGVG
jgi:uncharacterized phiE125 gp8 family phage protein